MTTTTNAWDAAAYDAAHGYVWRMADGLVDLLDPKPGERVLDLGCGTGHLAAEIAALGAAVVGVDASAEMVRQAATNYPALTFRVGDARTFEVDGPFDALFSNATLHWVKDADATATRMRAALRPGGRLVAEFGGAGNVRRVCAAIGAGLAAVGAPAFDALSPWYYPSIAQYAGVLERAGFDVTLATLFDRPTPIDAGLRAWVEMYGGAFTTAVPAGRREEFFDAVEQAGRADLFNDGTWVADYRRLRVVAVRG